MFKTFLIPNRKEYNENDYQIQNIEDTLKKKRVSCFNMHKYLCENKISFNHIFDIDDHLNIDGNIMAAKLLAELISMGEYTTTSLIRH